MAPSVFRSRGGGVRVLQCALDKVFKSSTVSQKQSQGSSLLVRPVLNMKILSAASFAVLLLGLSGLDALVLNQEKSISVTAGQNVKILCSPSTGDWALTWYQQKPGKSPAFLLVDSTRATGLPSRFTYSGSRSHEYLHINGVQAEDETVYYCACHGCEGTGVATFGGGTEVTFATQSPPSVVLLAPSQSPSSGDDVRVVCLARGFRPDGATLSWSEDGSTVAGSEVQTGASQRQSDGTFFQSSVLNLRPERWGSGRTYTCHVTHPALSTALSQSSSSRQCS